MSPARWPVNRMRSSTRHMAPGELAQTHKLTVLLSQKLLREAALWDFKYAVSSAVFPQWWKLTFLVSSKVKWMREVVIVSPLFMILMIMMILM